jgi:hypothetical protein
MTRTPRVRTFISATVAVIVVLLSASTAARAIPPGPPVRSASTTASFAGTTFDRAEAESVDLAGALHVVVRLTGSTADGWTVDWRANVDRASGTGETTGNDYVLTGAARGTTTIPPGPPTRTAFFEPTFTLLPPGPPTHPPSPCRFLVAVSFDEAGQVTGVDAHLADAPAPTTD